MSDTKVVYEYSLKEDLDLKFTASEFNGKMYYHIREYYKGYPTKRGIKFDLNEFPKFAEGLVRLKDYIDDNGIEK